MKDGRTHPAHKAELAVDLETGAMIAVTLQGADAGDTTTIVETAIAAAEQIEDAQADVTEPQTLDEIIAHKGYPPARSHEHLKRLLIHAGGFNLGLLMRAILGAGTPRGFQDRGGRAVAAVLDLIHMARELLTAKVVTWWSIPASRHSNC